MWTCTNFWSDVLNAADTSDAIKHIYCVVISWLCWVHYVRRCGIYCSACGTGATCQKLGVHFWILELPSWYSEWRMGPHRHPFPTPAWVATSDTSMDLSIWTQWLGSRVACITLQYWLPQPLKGSWWGEQHLIVMLFTCVAGLTNIMANMVWTCRSHNILSLFEVLGGSLDGTCKVLTWKRILRRQFVGSCDVENWGDRETLGKHDAVY